MLRSFTSIWLSVMIFLSVYLSNRDGQSLGVHYTPIMLWALWVVPILAAFAANSMSLNDHGGRRRLDKVLSVLAPILLSLFLGLVVGITNPAS